MKTTGLFITNDKGGELEVTDLKQALSDARMFNKWHEGTKEERKTNPDVFYCKEAHEYWAHILLELEKAAMKNPKLLEDAQ